MEHPNVKKILIQAYKDKTFNSKIDELLFTVPINPEQFSQKFEVKQDEKQGSGNQGTSGKYTATAPEELRLEFFLDGTKTVAGNAYANEPVHKQVELLLKTVYLMNGDTHQPNFLKIGWNESPVFGEHKTTFDCRLKSLDINYVLFNINGEPLRAKVAASFSAYVEDKKRAKQEDKKSPDLSQIRAAMPFDSLWLMTHRIYDDPRFVVQIARANNLDTFRRIVPGREYVFPPIDKTEIASPQP